MKKTLLLLAIIFPILVGAQTARDINTIIQQTLDLNVLDEHFSEAEKSGETPIIIINNNNIPNNLIIFKFNKRVKILTSEELAKFKQVYTGNLDSYFVFELMKFEDNKAIIKASFRKMDPIAISLSLKKDATNWSITESSAG